MKIGNTWWSGRFLRSLDRLGLSTGIKKSNPDLPLKEAPTVEVSTDGIRGQGFDLHPYSCSIEFAPFTDWEWEETLERLAFQDLLAAALLITGRLPPHIEDFFSPLGRQLLPSQADELELHCTCTDRSPLCRHLAATASIFAERLDRDPWLLFLVRGRSAQSIQDSLSERWNREAVQLTTPPNKNRVPIPPLPIDDFWEGGGSWDPAWEVPSGKTFPTVKRLGLPEPKVNQEAWMRVLNETYSTIAQRARSLRRSE